MCVCVSPCVYLCVFFVLKNVCVLVNWFGYVHVCVGVGLWVCVGGNVLYVVVVCVCICFS